MVNFVSFVIGISAPLATAVQMLPAATLETLQALDTDGSGRVELPEIEAFARSQGVDVQKAVVEFMELDKDNSGDLDVRELSATLESSPEGDELIPPAAREPPPPLPFEVASSFAPPPQMLPVAPSHPEVQLEPQPQLEQPPAIDTPVIAPSAMVPAPSPIAQALVAPVGANATVLLLSSVQSSESFVVGAVAEALARHAQQAMSNRSDDEAQAQELEDAAKLLEANASALLASIAVNAQVAAHQVVESIIQPALVKIKALEEEASAADADAQHQRGLAAQAMERAVKIQSELSLSVRNLRAGVPLS